MILGRQVCGHWPAASEYEWLVTNGLGGYAFGTAAGANTRRYHAFLMASLKPPVARTLLVAKVDVTAEYSGERVELAVNEFSGALSAPGLARLESFTLEHGIPTWIYAVGDALLQQQIFMANGVNTSYLRLEVLRAQQPLRVLLKPLVAYRDHHSHSRGEQAFDVEGNAAACRVQAPYEGAVPLRLFMDDAQFTREPAWYWNFWHRCEAERGMDAVEDLLMPGIFEQQLTPGKPAFLVATAEDAAPAAGDEVLAAHRVKTRRLCASLFADAPDWIRSLSVAADQFIVKRAPLRSVIAGYPWFADWGRDTMIALPGLTLPPRRFEIAAGIVRTFASFVDGGMLPNRFPDDGAAPEYNTADATLWMFDAIDELQRAGGESAAGGVPPLESRLPRDLLRELFPVLMQIIRAHAEGTRFSIQVDPADALLRAGDANSQLTWMDAKAYGHVFTPRGGKPVEINALWLNALHVAARAAAQLECAADERFCRALLARGTASFARFWNEDRGCLYDVVDAAGPNQNDASLRPNQIFAVSLPYSALPRERMRAVVDTCARELVTSYGLRSLGPKEPGYIGRYEGDVWHRDAAYHMGTVWSWLLGPFARAHFRVYGDARLARSYLAPMQEHVNSACLGTISEIFDGDPPHVARGCVAQAWSVAEILRSWSYLTQQVERA